MTPGQFSPGFLHIPKYGLLFNCQKLSEAYDNEINNCALGVGAVAPLVDKLMVWLHPEVKRDVCRAGGVDGVVEEMRIIAVCQVRPVAYFQTVPGGLRNASGDEKL